MKINFKIHKRNHVIKNIIGNIEYVFTKSGLKNNEFTVLNYHGTQKKFIHDFNKQIIFFQKLFKIISPDQLNDFYSGNLAYNMPLLLITFDDGIKNNLNAVEVLNKYDIKALFFIVPGFIDTPIDKQKEYFTKNIRKNINATIDSEIEDFTALSWSDINLLIKKGHKMGSHTQTHILYNEKDSKISENEIIQSKNNISQKLNLPLNKIDSFCSIFDTLKSVSKNGFQIIKSNYSFHFTTIQGPNVSNANPYFIKRVNIESFWLMGAVKFAIGKWDLKRWEKKTALINEMF